MQKISKKFRLDHPTVLTNACEVVKNIVFRPVEKPPA